MVVDPTSYPILLLTTLVQYQVVSSHHTRLEEYDDNVFQRILRWDPHDSSIDCPSICPSPLCAAAKLRPKMCMCVLWPLLPTMTIYVSYTSLSISISEFDKNEWYKKGNPLSKKSKKKRLPKREEDDSCLIVAKVEKTNDFILLPYKCISWTRLAYATTSTFIFFLRERREKFWVEESWDIFFCFWKNCNCYCYYYYYYYYLTRYNLKSSLIFCCCLHY